MKLRTRILSVVISVVTGILLLPSPSLAGLRVTGAKLDATVSPGDVIYHVMSVGLRDTDPAMDIVVTVKDFGGYSARDFITIDNPIFHLNPGESQDVTATVQVPLDAAAGGHYAIIGITQQQTSGSGVGVLVAVEVPVLLTIRDSQLFHVGKITGVNISEPVSGQPVEILTTFQNTGNHHFKVKGEVTVSDSQGKILDTIYLALTPSSIIPTMSMSLKATYIPKGELTEGVYAVKSQIMLEDGTLLDQASYNFEVASPYVAPPPPAGVTLIPSAASTLATHDGAISISFPKGAVMGQVDVSLRSYPLEQLPSPPIDFSLATTCFRVDGLTGLLAQDATVSVKYTMADLDKAGGDASKLVLARWDEATGQWSVLKTMVDKEAMTLTTQTNQFSIWAVMVSPTAQRNWFMICGIIVGVILVGTVLALIVMRRKARH